MCLICDLSDGCMNAPNQLISHFEKYNPLTLRQAGFRAGHSTQTALLGVLDDIRLSCTQFSSFSTFQRHSTESPTNS
ncbi:hypothetical protein TSAR_001585 [Trichomalopsis sarcophagae]|uniref:Uncharacterized protein n=1 Tax=Trichomalopsis sarcophagae TaxID=543379 RepID=A0A232ETX8_9HYME|nr:hypothetical protein TSAR_001585 [Trichomalopsis sarcophagae]